MARTPKRRRSAPDPEPDQPTESINGVAVSEEVLKKIGRNVLKDLGIGVEDRMAKVGSLSHSKRRALKSLQVNKNQILFFFIILAKFASELNIY